MLIMHKEIMLMQNVILKIYIHDGNKILFPYSYCIILTNKPDKFDVM